MKLEQIIFIVVASVVGLLIIGALLFRPIKKVIYKKKYINIYGRIIYQLVLDNDFFLINQLVLKLDDNNEMHIDHVIFGEKYIYVIKDRYYNGKIEGKPLDESWVFRNGKKSKYVDNPLILNSLRIEKLSLLSGIDKSFFIS